MGPQCPHCHGKVFATSPMPVMTSTSQRVIYCTTCGAVVGAATADDEIQKIKAALQQLATKAGVKLNI